MYKCNTNSNIKEYNYVSRETKKGEITMLLDTLGFSVSYYGEQYYVDIVKEISTISIQNIIHYVKENTTTIIVSYHGSIITEYYCNYDCFAFIPKNEYERMFAYELRKLYKRHKTIEPKNRASR